MKIIAIIATYPPDYQSAAIATAMLGRLGIEAVWLVGKDDDAPPHARVIRTSAPRNRNLNGHPWIAEQLAIMEELGAGYDWVMKVDSDTLVFNLDWLERFHDDPEINLVGCQHAVMINSSYLFGCCYAIRPALIPQLILHPYIPYPEDAAIGEMAKGKGVYRYPFHHEDGRNTWTITTPSRAAQDAQYIKRNYFMVTVFPDPRFIGDKHQAILSAMQELKP